MLAIAKEAFLKYLEVGTSTERGLTANQQLFVSNLFSFIGYSITLLLSISSAIRGLPVLSISLFAASCVFFFCHHIHRFPKLGNTILISTRLIFISLLILMVYLVYTGGVSNTGPLWIYIVPPVAFFFTGLRRGLKSLAAFTIIIGIMMFYPNELLLGTMYTFEFKTRLIYSFLTVTLLFGFYEYSRQKSYNRIRELSQKYEQLAMHDPLTTLLNRRGMRTHLEHEYSRLKRSEQPLSVLLCDIDHFKQVNDKYSHDGGDFVLENLSALFVQQIRQQDIVARWGGEEFLFLLPNTNSNDAFMLAEKIRKQVEHETFHYKNNAINVTLSIGVNQVNPKSSVDQAINDADHLLYLAKNRGRNRTISSNTLTQEKQTG